MGGNGKRSLPLAATGLASLCAVTEEDHDANEVSSGQWWYHNTGIYSTHSLLGRTLRIDFNHSRLNYYTEIDAIMLCGRTVTKTQNLLAKQQITQHSRTLVSPPPDAIGSTSGDGSGGSISHKLRTLKFQPNCGEDGATKLHEFINNDLSQFLADNCVDGEAAAPQICLTDLPFEILLRILSYLDLKSLFRVGHVSRTFYDISRHPLLYAEISLKPYWDVASSELLCTLARRATMLRKLDLSWCGGFGNVSPTEFKKWLHASKSY